MTKLKGKVKAKARKKKTIKSKMSAATYKRNTLAKILKYNDQTLSLKCEEVESGKDVSKVISKMKGVLGYTQNGVGLAASQIGILERVIVIRPDASKFDMIAMVNPKIISHSEEKKYGPEMCLSYPGVTGFIERYTSIEMKYFNENWEECTVKYKEGDLELLITQHEIDHLDGLCEIHDWWENPDFMSKKLQEVFDKKHNKKEDTPSYEVVESDDLKKEKAESSS